jgi:hypothetical protein
MFYNAWYSEGTEFTILADDKLELGTPIGNRTVYLKKLPELQAITHVLTDNIQTVGLAVDDQEFELITDMLGPKGVHRFKQVGTMTHFESPWDGYLIPQRLVRWVSRPPKHSSLIL